MPRKHGEYGSVRDCIHAISARLFTENGVHGTSLNDIAAAAKLSKGTLYYYYPVKDQLVLDVASLNTASLTDDMFSWVDSLDRNEDLSQALARLINVLTADPQRMRLHTVLCSEASCSNDKLASLLADAYREWTVMLEVGTLKLRSRNSRVVHTQSQLFFACLDGFMLQNPARLTELDRATIISTLL